MSTFFVDTHRLSERYEKGLRLKQLVADDLSELRSYISVICEELENQRKVDRSAELTRLMDEIDKTTGNITGVCDFDRFAIEEYRKFSMKLDDVISSVEI